MIALEEFQVALSHYLQNSTGLTDKLTKLDGNNGVYDYVPDTKFPYVVLKDHREERWNEMNSAGVVTSIGRKVTTLVHILSDKSGHLETYQIASALDALLDEQESAFNTAESSRLTHWTLQSIEFIDAYPVPTNLNVRHLAVEYEFYLTRRA